MFVLFYFSRPTWLGNTGNLRYVAWSILAMLSREIFFNVFSCFLNIGYKACFNVFFILTSMFFTTVVYGCRHDILE